MANIAAVLREEICRLAKKETKPVIEKIRKDVAELKRTLVDYRRRITELERDNRRLVSEAEARRMAEIKPTAEDLETARFTARSVRKLREKLGLSRREFGELLGVSGACITNWEQKDGRLALHERTKAALIEVRNLGVREARARLEEMEEEA